MSQTPSQSTHPGLEGVVVADTVLSHAEPERGMLWVRGRPIPDLVALGYEGTVALLWGVVGADLSPPACGKRMIQ